LKRNYLYGKGINDTGYKVETVVKGKRVMCPFYRKWCDMLTRAYSPKYKERHVTYEGVTVCEEWLHFSTFKEWMEIQDWEGKQLDKDLLQPGNKEYSPSTCLFVSSQINKLLTGRGATRGGYPQGVCLHKQRDKFQAYIGKYGKRVHLGLFVTVEEASEAYRIAKNNYIKEVAETQEEPIKSALLQHLL